VTGSSTAPAVSRPAGFQGHDHAVAVLIQPSNGDIMVVGKSTNSPSVTDLALASYLG